MQKTIPTYKNILFALSLAFQPLMIGIGIGYLLQLIFTPETYFIVITPFVFILLIGILAYNFLPGNKSITKYLPSKFITPFNIFKKAFKIILIIAGIIHIPELAINIFAYRGSPFLLQATLAIIIAWGYIYTKECNLYRQSQYHSSIKSIDVDQCKPEETQ